MSETVAQTWEQELVALGEARSQLREARGALLELVEAKFGPLPEATAQQIQGIEDLERLRQLFRRGLGVSSLADLGL